MPGFRDHPGLISQKLQRLHGGFEFAGMTKIVGSYYSEYGGRGHGGILGSLIRQIESRENDWKSLIDLLYIYQHAACQDARDKVFALLGLAMPCCKLQSESNTTSRPQYYIVKFWSMKSQGIHYGTGVFRLCLCIL